MDVLGGKAKGGLIPLIRPTPGSSIRVGPTPAGRGALARLLLVVATVLCLLASADIGSTAQAPQSGPIRESVLIDQGVLDLELEPGVGSPPVDQQRALTLAASHVSGASQATSVQARYVALTLRDASGNVRRGLEAQPAWIVTFGGVAYAPSGSSASVCSCAVVYQRPNTAVALDARTGALIALFGAEN